MKKLLCAIIFLLPFSAFSSTCFKANTKKTNISWTAFKTPKKVGVGGSFNEIKFKAKEKAKSVVEMLNEATAEVDTTKVNTKNPDRDKKIVKFFFKGIGKISAKINSATDKQIELEVSMNGKKVNVPMSYTVKDNKVEASGHLDIIDFGMNKNLAAINKACMALHEGKTWSHVELGLIIPFENTGC